MASNTCPIDGFDKVEDEVSKVRSRKLTYAIFEINQIDP